MFDIGWTELLVVACIAIIVVGPKDLPRMLRTFGQTVGKLRRMANEFQSTFNDALREAEKQADIDEIRKQVESVGNFDPLGDIKKSVEPLKKAGDDLAKDVGKRIDTGSPAKPAEAAANETTPAPDTTAVTEPPAASPANEQPAATPRPAEADAGMPETSQKPAAAEARPAKAAPAAKKAPAKSAAAKSSATKSSATKSSATKSSASKAATAKAAGSKASASKAPAAKSAKATSAKKPAAGAARTKTTKAKPAAPAAGGDTSDAGSTS